MNLSGNIKKEMRLKNITVSKLCTDLSLSESGLYLSLGNNDFKYSVLCKIAQYLGTTVDKLVNEFDPMELDFLEKDVKKRNKSIKRLEDEIYYLEKRLHDCRFVRQKFLDDFMSKLY